MDVGSGAIIGRMGRAEIQVPDPRVSEAHAMVSLRGRDVRLLSLRGRFAVDGRPLSELTLEVGQVIELAPGLALHVVDIGFPTEVLALRTPDLEYVPTGVTSILPGPPISFVYGWRPDAAMVLWPADGRWHSSLGPIDGETHFDIGDGVTASWIPTEGSDHTYRTSTWADPIRLVTRFDSVHIQREGRPVLVLTGIQARLCTELALCEAPLPWHELATRIWGDLDRMLLRKRWDVHQYRLRRRLREAGVRTDLVRADGDGLVELVLGPRDVWVDES